MNKKHILIMISIVLIALFTLLIFSNLRERRNNFAKEAKQKQECILVDSINMLKKDSLARVVRDSIFYAKRDSSLAEDTVRQETVKALGIEYPVTYGPVSMRATSTRKYWKNHVYMGEYEIEGWLPYLVSFKIHNTSDYDIFLVEAPNHGLNYPVYYEIPADSAIAYSFYASGELFFFRGKLKSIYEQDVPTEVKETFSIRYKIPISVVKKWAAQKIKEGKDEEDDIKVSSIAVDLGESDNQHIESWSKLLKFINSRYKK